MFLFFKPSSTPYYRDTHDGGGYDRSVVWPTKREKGLKKKSRKRTAASVSPTQIVDALVKDNFDAVTSTLNETSVANQIKVLEGALYELERTLRQEQATAALKSREQEIRAAIDLLVAQAQAAAAAEQAEIAELAALVDSDMYIDLVEGEMGSDLLDSGMWAALMLHDKQRRGR